MKNKREKLYLLAQSIEDLYDVTDIHGTNIKKLRSYNIVLRVVKNKAQLKSKGVLWVPAINKDKVWGVCGIKDSKNLEGNLKIINGIIDQINYEQFSKRQAERMLDPKSDFIKKLLTKKIIKSFDEAIDGADIVGLNVRSPQAVILISVEGLSAFLQKKGSGADANPSDYKYNRLIKSLKEGFKNYEQNIFAILEPDCIVCLKWARGHINTLNTVDFFQKKAKYISKIIENETGIIPTVGVGQYYPGLKGLRKSYDDAQTALDLGEKIWGKGKIYHIASVGMMIALSRKISFERKCELANQIMGKVFEDRDLQKTLDTFLEENLNLTVASEKMHIHRNTLIYRLEKVKKISGLDPRVFCDAIQLKIGLMLYGPKNN